MLYNYVREAVKIIIKAGNIPNDTWNHVYLHLKVSLHSTISYKALLYETVRANSKYQMILYYMFA